jgi:hypothetical protein
VVGVNLLETRKAYCDLPILGNDIAVFKRETLLAYSLLVANLHLACAIPSGFAERK